MQGQNSSSAMLPTSQQILREHYVRFREVFYKGKIAEILAKKAFQCELTQKE